MKLYAFAITGLLAFNSLAFECRPLITSAGTPYPYANYGQCMASGKNVPLYTLKPGHHSFFDNLYQSKNAFLKSRKELAEEYQKNENLFEGIFQGHRNIHDQLEGLKASVFDLFSQKDMLIKLINEVQLDDSDIDLFKNDNELISKVNSHIGSNHTHHAMKELLNDLVKRVNGLKSSHEESMTILSAISYIFKDKEIEKESALNITLFAFQLFEEQLAKNSDLISSRENLIKDCSEVSEDEEADEVNYFTHSLYQIGELIKLVENELRTMDLVYNKQVKAYNYNGSLRSNHSMLPNFIFIPNFFVDCTSGQRSRSAVSGKFFCSKDGIRYWLYKNNVNETNNYNLDTFDTTKKCFNYKKRFSVNLKEVLK